MHLKHVIAISSKPWKQVVVQRLSQAHLELITVYWIIGLHLDSASTLISDDYLDTHSCSVCNTDRILYVVKLC